MHPGAPFYQDFYIDVVDIETGPAWRATDLYLDIVVRTGRDQKVVDTDETLAALRAGLIDQAAAERAFDRAYRAIDGIAAAGRDVVAWLAGEGIPITWRG
jgi:predicted RNA-binding protein associated with RNAse of E/G family